VSKGVQRREAVREGSGISRGEGEREREEGDGRGAITERLSQGTILQSREGQ